MNFGGCKPDNPQRQTHASWIATSQCLSQKRPPAPPAERPGTAPVYSKKIIFYSKECKKQKAFIRLFKDLAKFPKWDTHFLFFS
jgi:hypothetical protein